MSESSPTDTSEIFTGLVNEQKILTDLRGKQWKLGPMVGSGGFGEIHLGSDNLSDVVNEKNAEFMIKLEPFSSASLFIEMYFYANAGRREYVEEWKESHQLQSFGMPYYFGCGSFYHGARRYRFIILPRYGPDLQTKFLNPQKNFSIKTAFTLASSVMDVLEYVHHRGYVHSDIKAANLVLDRNDPNTIYLIDYGLAYKIYNDSGRHKKLEPDQRNAHDGTIEFTSRDAHVGAHSRRSDLEILGYNIIKWITGKLPWECLSKEEQVSDMKTEMMNDVTNFLKECFEGCNLNPPESLAEYLNYINKLKFKDQPDYDYCRSLFRKAVEDAGYVYDKNMSFNYFRTNKRKKKQNNNNKENNDVKRIRIDAVRKTLSPVNPRVTRNSTPISIKFDWPTILAGHPDKKNTSLVPLITSPSCSGSDFMKEDSESDDCSADLRGMDNPTPCMKEIMIRLKIQPKNRTDYNATVSPINDPTPTVSRRSCFRQKKKKFKRQINRSSPLQKSTKCKPILMSPRSPFSGLRNECRVRFQSPLLGRITDRKLGFQQTRLLRCSTKDVPKNEKPLSFAEKTKLSAMKTDLLSAKKKQDKDDQCCSRKLLLRNNKSRSKKTGTVDKKQERSTAVKLTADKSSATTTSPRRTRSIDEEPPCSSTKKSPLHKDEIKDESLGKKRGTKKFPLKKIRSIGYRRNLRILSSGRGGFRFLR